MTVPGGSSGAPHGQAPRGLERRSCPAWWRRQHALPCVGRVRRPRRATGLTRHNAAARDTSTVRGRRRPSPARMAMTAASRRSRSVVSAAAASSRRPTSVSSGVRLRCPPEPRGAGSAAMLAAVCASSRPRRCASAVTCRVADQMTFAQPGSAGLYRSSQAGADERCLGVVERPVEGGVVRLSKDAGGRVECRGRCGTRRWRGPPGEIQRGRRDDGGGGDDGAHACGRLCTLGPVRRVEPANPGRANPKAAGASRANPTNDLPDATNLNPHDRHPTSKSALHRLKLGGAGGKPGKLARRFCGVVSRGEGRRQT